MTENPDPIINLRLVAALLGITIAGGLLIVASEVFAPSLLIVGLVLFGGGAIGAGVAAVAASRKTGAGVGKSLLNGLRLGVRWILEFMA